MVVPVGVGDCVALSNLVINIINAVRQIQRSASEYEQLLQLLFSLRTSFEAIQRLCDSLEHDVESSAGHQRLATVNALYVQLKRCREVLQRFSDVLSRYSGTQRGNLPLYHRAPFARAFRWTLNLSQEAEQACQQLQPHVAALQLLLTQCTPVRAILCRPSIYIKDH